MPKFMNPFTSPYIRKYPVPEDTGKLIQDYICKKIGAGAALECLLKKEKIDANEKKVALILLKECTSYEDRKGTVVLIRDDKMKNYFSLARKMMFFVDFLTNYPGTIG